MDNLGVTKAPLTRSRRRLSLEQAEEVKAPVTPTKKRGRAAAKPQLDDIDENTPINSPRRTHRISTKDTLDVLKSDTPTSVLTPARRSSRINSNTSITESSQNFESPRAIRATRRLSKTGSDADTPTLTPTKTLRRTRRSMTNNESLADTPILASQQQIINEVLPEESEQLDTSSKSQKKDKPAKVRKSPRLSVKSNSENNTPEKDKSVEQNNDNKQTDKIETQNNVSTATKTIEKSNKTPQTKDFKNIVPCFDSNKRNRTDSLNISGKSEDISFPSFFSDNEGGKVKKNKKSRKISLPNGKENIQSQDELDACFVSHSINIHNDELVSPSHINKIEIEGKLNNILNPKIDRIEDSNSCSPDKASNNIEQEIGDQCVPEVEPLIEDKDISETKISTSLHSTNEPGGFMSKRDRTVTDISCEPMDIDETIPENVSMQDYSNNNLQSPIKNKPTDTQETKTTNTGHSMSESKDTSATNKSKRKSSIKNELEIPAIIEKPSLIESQVSKTSIQIIEAENDKSNIEAETPIKNKSINKSHSQINVSNDFLNKSSNKNAKTLNVSQLNEQNTKTQNYSHNKSLNTPIKLPNQNILTMQTSTPVETQPKLTKKKVTTMKTDNSDTDIQQKQKNSQKYKILHADDSSDESDDSNKLVIEEAEEAADDYESGDSMDEEERQYMEENEIVEKGESIGSDTSDCSSYESDYDKDSFLVSSNEEDNELLSGSGDDLSMSDNELSMSKKSKDKYDKRKLKEQKQASREMYEARNGIKNKKEQRSESSLLSKNLSTSSQDQEENQNVSIIKGIRHNRMRIESEVTETEISAIVNESVMDKQDPLQKAIKEEPKTPQNSFNISNAKIHIQPNIEHLEVDENATLMKSNTTHDPLENMSEDDEPSLGSENEEIKDNYESLLNNLNKSKDNKNDSKIKQSNIDKGNNKVKDSDSSDSIDLKLLFPDNNCDSDSSNEKSKHKKEVFSSDENFIPLKRVEGKTNIREGEDEINVSVTKEKVSKKNKKLSETMPTPHNDTSTSLKPKKDKFLSQSLTIQVENVAVSSMVETPDANQSATSKKGRNSLESSLTVTEYVANQSMNSKKKKISESSMVETQDANQSANSKKRKNSLESSLTITEQVANQSMNSKKKKTSESFLIENEQDANQLTKSKNGNNSLESSLTVTEQRANQSMNTKKKKTFSESSLIENKQDANQSTNSKKGKNCLESSMTLTGHVANQLMNSTKKKISESSNQTKQEEHQAEVLTNQSLSSKKKKKVSESSTIQEEHDANQSLKSKKKKGLESSITKEQESLKSKHKHSESPMTNQESLTLDKKGQTSLKKNKNKCQSSDDSRDVNKDKTISHDSMQTSNDKIRKVDKRGRKRKMSDSFESINTPSAENPHTPLTNKKKKKLDEFAVAEHIGVPDKNNRKRKQRPEEVENKKNKIISGFLDKLPVPRLPTTVLDQLDEKSKTNVLSTTMFSVENNIKRKTKPSEYLEDSIYLNSQSPEKKRRKQLHKKPKVLPFVPTACTSGSGFTTSFQISVVPKVVEFIAQSSVSSNFKMDRMKHTKQSASKYKPQKRTANMSKY